MGAENEYYEWDRQESSPAREVAQILGGVTISVDFENNAEEWWAAAQTATNVPSAIAPLLFQTRTDSVRLDSHNAARALEWCESLPGWDNGPTHAPHPLCWCPTDEDEEQEEVPS